MRKQYVCACKRCNKTFTTTECEQVFCSRSCAAKTNLSGRKLSNETKIKIKESLKRYIKLHPHVRDKTEASVQYGMKATRGRFNGTATSLLQLSSRTVRKILARMNIPCSHCGWMGDVCDLHHIHGKRIPNADHHDNLCYICPNCHRMCHSHKIKKEELINLSTYIGNKWKDFYYG